ncbi:MAG: gamma carbonic anhydrase family protein [Pseudomonadales bacterium]|nr:gamma carbonic anhydrase family protein [Pseudomonadales bacterium]MCP5182769.1 gamma carbonic anhydrase family protein [Pseudomonadales bacterium]
MLLQLGDKRVRARGRYFVADNARVIGNVLLEDNASVWFGAVIRGDSELITLGENCNVQDGAILHTDPGFPLTLGRDVTIGHMAMLHGCTVGEGSLIGIGAIVLNGAKIGRNCLVGAGALVTEGKEFPDNSMILGSPARVAKTFTDEQAAGLRANARHYVRNGQRFSTELTEQEQADV